MRALGFCLSSCLIGVSVRLEECTNGTPQDLDADRQGRLPAHVRDIHGSLIIEGKLPRECLQMVQAPRAQHQLGTVS